MNPKTQVKFINKDKSVFFSTLKTRVDVYFKENKISKHADNRMVIKTIVLILVYILPFIAILVLQPSFWPALILWVIMGFGAAGVGMSIMHDANHGAYSKKKSMNDLMGYTLNLVGGSVPNWKLQHNVLHHTYTNIHGLDGDIDDKVILRFSPHTKVKWYHKFQFVYAFLFYGITTIYWALLKDFVQFFGYIRRGINPNKKRENIIAFSKIVLVKAFYFFIFLVVPTLIFGMAFSDILIGFLAMHVTTGIILTVIFQLAHTVEGTSHPLPDENGNIENAWAIHQLQTTVDFAPDNKFLTWYLGGLNYQVEHHLFPGICHIHYPKIASIVKNTSEEFGIPYLQNRSFFKAVKSHIASLQRFGNFPHINEAIV